MDTGSDWVPQVGQVIYTADGSTDEDAWDDTELIAHWDAALAEYRRKHGKEDAPPFSTHESKKKSKEKSAVSKKMKIDEPRVPDNTNLSKAKLPKPPQMPPLACNVHPPFYPNQSIPHGNYTQMIMAWYYAGYYTGYLQGRRSHSRNPPSQN
ncbi:hypothetical protein VTP01DRAFT_5276 [Rhizomucor pusillus]|uniref:uncharacterized protein n=1 Tax=Rhizomucor pusillus TaxID=4840 RepID=UPI003744A2E9